MAAKIERDKETGIILFATLAMLVLLSAMVITAQNSVVNQALVAAKIFQIQDHANDIQSVHALAAPQLMEQIEAYDTGTDFSVVTIRLFYARTQFQVEITDRISRQKFKVQFSRDELQS